MGTQIQQVSDFDLDDWDAIDGLDDVGLVWPEYEGMYGLDDMGLDFPDYNGMYGLEDVGCSSCMAGLDAPPAAPAAALAPSKQRGFPWGTVLIGVGGVGVGVLAAVLVKKYVLK